MSDFPGQGSSRPEGFGQEPHQPQDPTSPYVQQPQAFGTPVDPGQQTTPPQGYGIPGAGYEPAYASFGKRLKGWVLDWFLPGLVLSVLSSLLFGSAYQDQDGHVSIRMGESLSYFPYLLIMGAYLTFMTRNGQTPGRRWAHTQLVDAQGRPMERSGSTFLRYVFHFVDHLICGIGWLFPIWDRKGQTLADKIAKTYVIDLDRSARPGQVQNPWG